MKSKNQYISVAIDGNLLDVVPAYVEMDKTARKDETLYYTEWEKLSGEDQTVERGVFKFGPVQNLKAGMFLLYIESVYS